MKKYAKPVNYFFVGDSGNVSVPNASGAAGWTWASEKAAAGRKGNAPRPLGEVFFSNMNRKNK